MKIMNINLDKKILLYLIFGILTSLINYFSFWIVYTYTNKEIPLVANLVSFILATNFAFFTNKIWVFKDDNFKANIILKELSIFLLSRIGTFLIIEELGMFCSIKYLSVDKYSFLNLEGTMLVKIGLSFIAVIFNYLISEKIIFDSINRSEYF